MMMKKIVIKTLQYYRNLTFGLATNARACKVVGQEGGPGVTSHALESAKNVRE